MKAKVFYFDSNGQPLPYSEIYDMSEEIDDIRADEGESDFFEPADE